MVEEDAPPEPDENRLNQKRERRVSQREVAVRRLPQRDAEAAVQNVTRVPKHRQMRILPQDNGCAGQQETARRDEVAQTPAAPEQRAFELGRLGLVHLGLLMRSFKQEPSRPAQSLDSHRS